MKVVIGVLVAAALVAGAWFAGLFSSSTPNPAAVQEQTEAAPETEPETAPEPEPVPEVEAEPAAAETEQEPQAETDHGGAAENAETGDAAIPFDGPPAPPATRQLGWMHGDCLVSEAEGLAAGTALTIVMLDDPQTVVGGEVTGAAEDAEACNLLDEQRRTANAEQGNVYTVKSARIVDFGAAIVHGDGAGDAPDPQMLDVNEDGILDTFARCVTADGMRFTIWNAEPYNSTELWRGSYRMGEESVPTCPPG